jgi:hypothetical protein
MLSGVEQARSIHAGGLLGDSARLREMKPLFLFIFFVAVLASGADIEPPGYSPDLYPVVQRAVAEIYRGMWGRETNPPKRFVMEALSLFHFQRIDLNRDGQEEVIATTAELPNTPNGDIFVFKRGPRGWTTIGAFDGYGGYSVTDAFVGGYRTIRTKHADDPATYASFHVATYTFRRDRYEASTAKERARDASRN